MKAMQMQSAFLLHRRRTSWEKWKANISKSNSALSAKKVLENFKHLNDVSTESDFIRSGQESWMRLMYYSMGRPILLTMLNLFKTEINTKVLIYQGITSETIKTGTTTNTNFCRIIIMESWFYGQYKKWSHILELTIWLRNYFSDQCGIQSNI